MNGSPSVHAVFCAKKWKQGRNCGADAIFGKKMTLFGNWVVRDKNSCYFFHRERQDASANVGRGPNEKAEEYFLNHSYDVAVLLPGSRDGCG